LVKGLVLCFLVLGSVAWAQTPASGVKVRVLTDKEVCDEVKFVRKFPYSMLNSQMMAAVAVGGIGVLDVYLTQFKGAKQTELVRDSAQYLMKEAEERGALKVELRKAENDFERVKSRVEKKLADYQKYEIKFEQVKGADGKIEIRMVGRNGASTPVVNESLTRLAQRQEIEAQRVALLQREVTRRTANVLYGEYATVQNALSVSRTMRSSLLLGVASRFIGYAGLALLAKDGWDYVVKPVSREVRNTYQMLSCSPQTIKRDPFVVFTTWSCLTDDSACEIVLKDAELRKMAVNAAEITRLEMEFLKERGIDTEIVMRRAPALLLPPSLESPGRLVPATTDRAR
jgi:hypothetical protein